MKILFLIAFLLSAGAHAQTSASNGETPVLPNSPLEEMAGKNFFRFASNISVETIRELPMQSNGRIKPFDTVAREAGMFLSGSRKPLGLDPIAFYLAYIVYEGNNAVEAIEVRNTALRAELGFPKEKRYYSLMQLEQVGLEKRVQPLLPKEEANRRSLTPLEQDLIGTYHQYLTAREVASGGHFLGSIDFTSLVASHPPHDTGSGDVIQLGKQYLTAISQKSEMTGPAAADLIAAVRAQPVPDLFSQYRSKLRLEIIYNHWRPFLAAGVLYFCLGLALLFGLLKGRSKLALGMIFAAPLLIHILGFATRVFITGLAPVTSMYGTMVWVAFGVALFSIGLLILYSNQILVGVLILGSSLVLLLTESFPLILSPDMDPVVAVLRSNYWLTLHVLTITISYAAFTVCMLIGNFGLIRTILGRATQEFYKTYSHYVYRMAQLGVFLITAGIILGGIWADYSWGRFWGWDPKETWALIADMGFIMMLHARFVGWLKPFGMLAYAPVAYLLVIMAWYGVNFVLAAGLHSYGFSSGGATFVTIFVSLQLILLFAASYAFRKRNLRMAA